MSNALLLVSIFMLHLPAMAQHQGATKPLPDWRDVMKSIDTNAYGRFKRSYPITRDTLNKYPDSIVVDGKIVDYTLGLNCGCVCGCGTLKIKLRQKPPDYAKAYI
ncbi:MAG TPA: hypothetical protein VGS79_15275 [Puia sp.]|nr:hypothetical protein [Puia sp.]